MRPKHPIIEIRYYHNISAMLLYPSYFKMHNQQIERRGYSRHEVENLVILNQDFITSKIPSFGLPYGRLAGITAQRYNI